MRETKDIITKELSKAIYTAHQWICFYTWRKLTENNSHIDHILPLSFGWKTEITNLVLCDKKINLMKNDMYDPLLIERMIYINRICFVHKVFSEMSRTKRQIYKFNNPILLKDFLTKYNMNDRDWKRIYKIKKLNCNKISKSKSDYREFEYDDLKNALKVELKL